MDDRDHLDLETGEVFERPRYAKFRKHEDKLISAYPEVYKARDESDFVHNRMRYFEAIEADDYGQASSINLQFFLHPRDFGELLKNVQSGVIPSTVHINFEWHLRDDKSPIKYGWEPDGSGKKWNNKSKEGRSVPIESLSFHYELLNGSEDPDTGERLTGSVPDIAHKYGKELKEGLSKSERER